MASPSLSTQLREGTRDAHVATEAAFALESRLSGRGAYGGLLADLRGFYGPIEAALTSVRGWAQLTPPLDVPSRCRSALLDEDLRGLGIAAPLDRVAAPLPALPSLAHGLGCLYVIEGSALGGRIVARRARAALGSALPVAFFSSAGRDEVGADWGALQAALDAFGAGNGAARGAALRAARATFAAMGAHLRGAPVPA